MAQHRDPPAFQEYAASMMARTDYRVLSLDARGLLFTLRLECWVNRSVPGNPAVLARVLGFDAARVEKALAEITPFFVADDGNLRCPELDDYRAHLDQAREKLSAAGKAGAAKTNGSRSGPATSTPPAIPRPPRGPLVKQSPNQFNTAKSLDERPLTDPWVREYERVSNGH